MDDKPAANPALVKDAASQIVEFPTPFSRAETDRASLANDDENRQKVGDARMVLRGHGLYSVSGNLAK
jgi:hypothetical protein